VDRTSLTLALTRYAATFPSEQPTVLRFLDLLQHPQSYHRDHLPGHITGSAWIVTPDRNKVLLVHHARLKKWLQPGGHADGDEDILRVALREAEEETGLIRLLVHPSVFDIDIHPIPARSDFPAHDHYDIRFLVAADEREELIISHESTDLRWIALNDLQHYNRDRSLLRMRDKTVAAGSA
jgi:8-oxo-dGTP pyrophosphatase MutT (NUDIX family)